jgi:hypothetical protein
MMKLDSMLCPTNSFARNGHNGRAKIRKNYFNLLLWVSMILFAFSPAMRGQELAGTFSGTIMDSSGAVVQNATITITLNGVNGEPRVVQSNGSGNYTATNLQAGTYTITVTGPNFSTVSVRNIVLNVAQKRTVDAQLKIGSQSQTVTVEENPVTVDTESSSQAGTISGTQVRELELVNRNFEQLVTLQPGVVNILGDSPGFGGLNSNTSISVNGARTTANNWTVDGADINDSGANSTLLNVPSVDAIQEFTLERSSYDASFGRSGGGQVLVATRSGTSSFHGSAYEFVRTENTDANYYFNKQDGTPRTPDHYNNFGFTVGGPIFIPHVYNASKQKTFFFWSEEWRKVSTPTSNNVPAPTAAELGGAFYAASEPSAPAGCITGWTPNPNTQVGGGTGTINPSCYSANTNVYLSQVLSKNQANVTSFSAAQNFTFGNQQTSFATLDNFRQDLVRIDHYFNDKLHFFARGMEDDAPSNLPTGQWGNGNYPGVVNVGINAPGKNVVANLTWTISPKMVNELEFAYSQGTINSVLSGPANSPSVLGSLTNNLASQDPYGRIPSVTIADASATVVSQGAAPYNERNLDRNIFDNFTVTLGNHTLRAGVTAQQLLKTENGGGGQANFTFNSWGDFLLGNASLYTQANRDVIPDLHFWNTEAYIQDDWKVSHRLTLNLGVRWTRFPAPTDAKNTLTNFDPLLYKPILVPALDGNGNFVAGQAFTPSNYANGLIFPKGAACSAAQAVSSQVTCSPYGGTVNPNNNWNFGPRVGFAYNLYGNTTVLRGGFGIFFDRTSDGVWEQNAFSDPPLVQTTTISNTTFDNPVGAGSVSPATGPNSLTTTGDPNFKVPSYAAFNLSLQEQLAPTTVLEIAYVGSASRHMQGEMDTNIPTLATREANPLAPLNNIRPYLGYSFFKDRLPIFTGNYSSLQVSLNHRTARDLTVGLSYTWSKNLTDSWNDRGTPAAGGMSGAPGTASTYAYNPRLDYGASGLNQPQSFIGNFVYKTPFFRDQHGLVGHTLGGWEVSGIVTLNSGLSTSAYQKVDPFACTTPSAADPASPTNPLCTADSPAGTYPGGLGMVSPNSDVYSRPDQVAPIHLTKTQTQWFSTSSFATAEGHFGTSKPGNILSPGMEKVDLGLMKNFRFSKEINLQLRAEAFNLFNHTNFSIIDTGIGDTAYGQATSAHAARTMQFSGKMYF